MKPIDKFIEYAKKETKEAGVKLHLSKVKYLRISEESYLKCDGWFDSEEKILKCAINRPVKKWLMSFVHEFSHFQQWKNNSKAWRETSIGKIDAHSEFFEWINGKKISSKKLEIYCQKALNVELECEKMAVKNIRKFDLPIDVEEYIQKANAYIWLYKWILIRRAKWPSISPSIIPQITSKMPKRFKRQYHTISEEYLKLYDKYCI